MSEVMGYWRVLSWHLAYGGEIVGGGFEGFCWVIFMACLENLERFRVAIFL